MSTVVAPAPAVPPSVDRPVGSLLRFALAYWRGFTLITAVTVVSSAVTLLQPWPLQIAVDHVLGGKPMPPWLVAVRDALPGAASAYGAMAWVGVAALVIFAVISLIDIALTMAWIRVAQRMVYDLACSMFARLQRRSLAFHARTPVGDSISRVAGDSWALYNAASALLYTPAHALLSGGLIIAVMVRLNGPLTLLSVTVAPVLAVSAIYFGRRLQQAKGVERQAESGLESHVQQTLAGIPVVQAFGQSAREHARFVGLTGQAIRAQRRSAIAAAMSTGASQLVTALGAGAILWFGSREVLHGRLTIGQLLVFLTYLTTLHAQMVSLAETYTSVRGLGASARRVREVLDGLPEVQDAPGAVPLKADGPLGIRFESVRAQYEPGRPILRDVSLDIRPGEMLALVGGSGAGKSTLAGLVPRLLDVSGGRVLVADRDVRDWTLPSLRGHVALVPQDSMLLAMSVADNIAVGRPGAPRDAIEAAAAAAAADAFIADLPEGYDTVLGERGATLSGGERQRIAIARALLRDAPVLILDEPTSALDADTESRILRSIDAQRGRRTVLLIAHRLSTARIADRIVVLADGRVAEQGTHDSLLRQGGLYAGLWHAPATPGDRPLQESSL